MAKNMNKIKRIMFKVQFEESKNYKKKIDLWMKGTSEMNLFQVKKQKYITFQSTK